MGDLGYQDADGYLHLVDRADDVVKTGALAVSTLRVEAALHEHPAVADVAVAGVPHPVLGQVLAAAVVPAGEHRDAAALRAFLARRLGRHELPARIRFTDARGNALLTQREETIVYQVAEGLRNREIAEQRGRIAQDLRRIRRVDHEHIGALAVRDASVVAVRVAFLPADL